MSLSSLTPISILNGLILAGGRSSRMGTDKGLLVYHDKPQREFLFELMQDFCDRVYTSCRLEQGVLEKLNPLPDKFDIAGPINGILTAFDHEPDSAWIAIAVDMPYVGRDTLKLLVDSRDASKVATCFYNKERQSPEPLLTLWEKNAHPLLLDFTKEGKISPKEFLATHPVKLIHPPDQRTLLNFNTPNDLTNR